MTDDELIQYLLTTLRDISDDVASWARGEINASFACETIGEMADEAIMFAHATMGVFAPEDVDGASEVTGVSHG